MRILLVLEHSGVGPLVPALRLLHERGHTIHVASRRVKTGQSHQELQALADESPRITYGQLPSRGGTRWTTLTRQLRLGVDYLRYLEPRYRNANKLRARAEQQAPPSIRRLGRIAALAGPAGTSALRRSLQLVERSLVPPRRFERFLEEQRPDLVLVTPLVDLGSRQADWLRAAKRLGIRTGYPVFSWDNLTNKGLVRDVPDRVLVWNDLQAREAEELHRIPADRIRVTGAPVCDPWFAWSASRTRDEFCREVGLRADRPIVLYLCSSQFVAPNEVGFVPGWIDRLRAWGEPFSEAGFLVRPYPDTAGRWLDADVEGPQVRVWPRFGESPHDEATRRNFYDSIFHSAAVVGINTTAQIESAIVGRPVHTLLAEEFRDTQEGTLHFHYLQADEFGLLFVGRDFDEHAEQLAESLRGRVDDDRNERFLRRFVRPLGLDRSATQLMVEAIEELGARPAPSPDRGPVVAPLVRLALAPVAALAGRGSIRAGEKKKPRDSTPARELRRTVVKLRGGRSPASIVAGPWLGDEIGELLYWIPFLRWTQTGSVGLRERLVVARRASTEAWYDGIGGSRVDPEHVEEGAQALSPDAVSAARPELAAQDPARRIQHRLIEFAPLATPELPAGLELPEEFVAVRFEPGQAAVAAAFAGLTAVVALDGLDRSEQTAVLARARGFAGTYGVEAYVAVLLGLPAAAFVAAEPDPDDLRIASSFLARPPYGRLHAISAAGSPADRAEQALALIEQHAQTLAGVAR
jgi:hypothetical protein